MVFHNKWISRGYPANQSWGWNKAQPKKSLNDIGMAHTANALMLNFVEFVHVIIAAIQPLCT